MIYIFVQTPGKERIYGPALVSIQPNSSPTALMEDSYGVGSIHHTTI